MTREQKDLLFKDLCSRLPYGVKVKIQYYDDVWKLLAIYTNGTTYATRDVENPIETYFEECKPYLFPLSSMTAIQENEFHFLFPSIVVKRDEYGFVNIISKSIKDKWDDDYNYQTSLRDWKKGIQWLLKNHFDINGLIPKKLANNATNLNIY